METKSVMTLVFSFMEITLMYAITTNHLYLARASPQGWQVILIYDEKPKSATEI